MYINLSPIVLSLIQIYEWQTLLHFMLFVLYVFYVDFLITLFSYVCILYVMYGTLLISFDIITYVHIQGLSIEMHFKSSASL